MTALSLASVLHRLACEYFPDATPAVIESLVIEHATALQGPGARRTWSVTSPGGEAAGILVEGGVEHRAWLMGLTLQAPEVREHAAHALEALQRDAAVLGQPLKIRVGGPPGSYLVSGINARDTAALQWFAAAGFTEERRHVDLHVTTQTPDAPDARVRRAQPNELDALMDFLDPEFAPAWQIEVDRALRQHDAVFVSGSPGSYTGFSAHSGNNAALGTFGPLGVVASERKAGLGAALARAALDDLHVRGHIAVTIPWVDPGLEPFYRRLVASTRVVERVLLARTL